MSMNPADPRAADHGLRSLLALDGVHLAAPPHFEDAVGYGGDRRYVAFYWCADDCPVVEDGVTSRTGHRGPWLLWARHPAVQPSLDGVDYGSCDGAPDHFVVLDRFSRRLYAGDVAAALRFLADAPDLRAEREA